MARTDVMILTPSSNSSNTECMRDPEATIRHLLPLSGRRIGLFPHA